MNIVQNDSIEILDYSIIRRISTPNFNFFEMIIIVSIKESKPFALKKFQKNFQVFEKFAQMTANLQN